MWFKLGVELLQDKDVAALEAIKNNKTEIIVCCSDMFKLWLNREPKASWRNLIDTLKQIHQNKLAFDIENFLSVRQANEEIATVNQTLIADRPTLTQRNNGGMSFIVCVCACMRVRVCAKITPALVGI